MGLQQKILVLLLAVTYFSSSQAADKIILDDHACRVFVRSAKYLTDGHESKVRVVVLISNELEQSARLGLVRPGLWFSNNGKARELGLEDAKRISRTDYTTYEFSIDVPFYPSAELVAFASSYDNVLGTNVRLYDHNGSASNIRLSKFYGLSYHDKSHCSGRRYSEDRPRTFAPRAAYW